MYPLGLFLCFFSLLFSLSTLRGFSPDRIHHDSLLLPFDDNSSPTSFELNITATKYSYLIGLNVTIKGHPTVSTHANLDTGSDLIWLNGKGCKGNACFCDETECVQKPSTTPEKFEVRDVCNKLPKQEYRYSEKENTCQYKLKYLDNFTTEGILTKDNFSLTSSDADHRSSNKTLWFGVSDSSEGILNEKSAGIVGLGRGELSLIRQLSDLSTKFPFKFSYCLPHPNSKSVSKLLLGSKVTISDNYAQLLSEEKGCDEHYSVRLSSIILNGDTSNEINLEHENNIMLIDSGSTFTFLNEQLFKKFIVKVQQITGENTKALNGTYPHCFKQEKGKNLKTVSFEFQKSVKESDKRVKVNLKEVNFFEKIEHEKEDYLCSMVVEGKGTQNVLGNRAQIDFKVAIGFEKNDPMVLGGEWKVSFDEENCGTEQNVEESLDFQE